MKYILFTALSLLLFACAEPKPEFSLTGITKGIENGEYLYLGYQDKNLDSALVQNNAFTFTTTLSEYPIRVILRNKDYSNYTSIWIENVPMHLEMTGTNFRTANITGSDLQIEEQFLYRDSDSLSPREMHQKEMEFVIEHPNSLLSAYLLSFYATSWKREKTAQLFEGLTKENKETKYGREIARYLEINKEPQIGDFFTDVTMQDQNGQMRSLSEFKGKTVLLEFWASNCFPCRKENPNLVKTYETFQPKGFEIFAVSIDIKKEDWLKAIEQDGLPWTQVSDLKGQKNEASLVYGVSAIPNNFLIDSGGKIIARDIRGEALNEKLAEILNESTSR